MSGRRASAVHYAAYEELYRLAWGDILHHGLWRSGRETQPEAVAALSREIADMAALRSGQRIYDVGCGYGAMSHWLAREYGVKVVGVNNSAAQLALAGDGGDQVRFLHTDWLGFSPEPAEAVLAVESADHLADKADFFRQCARALVPGGRLVVAGLMTRERLPERSRRRLDWICARSPLAPLVPAAHYAELAEHAGFALEEIRDLTQETARTWPEFARRFARAALRRPGLLRHLAAGGPSGWLPLLFWHLRAARREGTLRYGALSARRIV